MSLKLVPAALLLLVVVAAGLGQSTRSADALVSGPLVPGANQMTSGSTPIPILIPLNGGNEDVTIEVTGFDQVNLSGVLEVFDCNPEPPGCTAGELSDTIVADAETIVIATDGLDEIIVTVFLTCTQSLSVTIAASTGPGDIQTTQIGCSPIGQGDGFEDDEHAVEVGGVYQVVMTAHPNILPCEGGTTTLTAELVDNLGNVLVPSEFRFFTTAGTIVQTDPGTAKLTLGPNQTSAIVTATIPDDFDLDDVHIDEAVTTVNLDCNGDATTQTLVVTASPNVIDCTGTTTITASVRDRNGHVIEGRGYHFVTSAGLLTVDPNNAENEEAVATLKLRPGDGDATVVVSSGLLHGTFEELDTANNEENVEDDFVTDETAMVTVKQNCLTTTTGSIKVNSSASTVSCGENVFIGLSVKDDDIQTVVDNTPMTLIASAGGFYGGIDQTTGGQALLPAAQVPTSHGEANTIYTAPANFNGEVKITAASGDAYGSTKINVTCVNVLPPSTGTGGGTGSQTPACTPIGDGVCITPPNTGRNFITPPSTGNGGLK